MLVFLSRVLRKTKGCLYWRICKRYFHDELTLGLYDNIQGSTPRFKIVYWSKCSNLIQVRYYVTEKCVELSTKEQTVKK